MAGFSLELPTIQNWSCHSCSGCCRKHCITITDAEHQRLSAQQWSVEDGVPAGVPLFVRIGSWFGRRSWRLGHQPDGRCVFLDDRGLCRIHAKFGEAAKPLACRIYPYAFHPKGRQVVVSLRFSCPSVAANRGRPVREQSRDLRELAAQVVPSNVRSLRPPRLKSDTQLEWDDLLRVVQALEELLTAESAPLPIRLLRALRVVELVEAAKFDKVTGDRLSELLSLLMGAAEAEWPDDQDLSALPPPTKTGRTMFRLHAGQYARVDSFTSTRGTLRDRWRLLTSAVRLARGRGMLPVLQESLSAVPFEVLETPRGRLPEDATEMWVRYFRVKLQGLHFCGRAYYDVPLVEGFRSLTLVYPVVMWLARWHAASAGRDGWTTEDLAAGLSLADHHHGYSPALGGFGARGRVRTLHRAGELPRLIAWYSR